MKDLGRLKYFLGIEVARSADGFFLSQRKYAIDIIAEMGLLGTKPYLTPVEQNHHLALDDGLLYSDPQQYRRLVGRLVYLSHTRPELSYPIHILSQFMQSPREAHWDAAIRVVRYLKSAPGQGILLRSDADLSLSVYCDADYNACPLSRRSLTAYVVFLGGSPVSWKTKKQETVSMSSAESEYRSMSDATKEIKWLRQLLSDLGVKQYRPVRMYCDSQAAIHIAKNPVFHERTKHIKKDCHNTWDAVTDGLLTLIHVRTHEQLADILTKPLGHSQFDKFIPKLGIVDLHAPT